MRLNRYIAQATGLSRRAADATISEGRVQVNSELATLGQTVQSDDRVSLDGQAIAPGHPLIIMLHKPAGYVVSRNGQGNPTIYDLLPEEYRHLKPVGRLDKDSSGLLLLTDEGTLTQQLTHPSFQKEKIYEVELDRQLADNDATGIGRGIELEDGMSRLVIKPIHKTGKSWRVAMTEGRNRQIRRTFAALGYEVTKLHRTHFGPYKLERLPAGQAKIIGEYNS